MRFRHFFAFIFCALAQHALAAPATDGNSGCEVSYSIDGVMGATEYHLPAPSPVAVPAPLELKGQIALDKESYADVYGILKSENACSRFFGGPAQAVEAFNQFALQLKKKPLKSRNIAVRMSGTFGTFRNNRTGAEYRLFNEATVNSNGPFFRQAANLNEKLQTRVGSFPAFTRRAKALALLHELGHLVAGADGNWVLPNDGGDLGLSERNTQKVEEVCLKQLLTVK